MRSSFLFQVSTLVGGLLLLLLWLADWASRSIEIVVPPRKLTPGYAAVQRGGAASGDASVAFKDKDVLSQGQTLQLLKAMDQRGF